MAGRGGRLRDLDRVLQIQHSGVHAKSSTAIHTTHLCRYGPQTVNRLVQSRGDKAKMELSFEEFLNGRRVQRKGFSEWIRVEIEFLQRFHAHKMHVTA